LRTVSPRIAFLLLAILAVSLLLWLGRAHTFTDDEFDFLGRSPTVQDLLRPHYDHLVALPILAYQTLIALFGTGTYLPFLGLLLALHSVAAAGLYRLVGGWMGVLAGAVMLFLGSGYENLFWAFQITFVGSVAAGLWAMNAREPRLAAFLFGVGLTCSGIGLVFGLPLAIALRRGAVWLSIPLALYTVWYVASGVQPAEPGSPNQLVAWIVVGIGWAFSGLFGTGLPLGIGVAAASAVAAIGSRHRTAIVAVVGLVLTYAVIGLGRSGGPLSFVAAPRYVYVAAPFVLLALDRGIPDPRLTAFLYGLALVVNMAALPAGASAW
jgi:hypothetical protein